jgi:hypothetical protein
MQHNETAALASAANSVPKQNIRGSEAL